MLSINAANAMPHVDILAHTVLGSGFARVSARITHKGNSRENRGSILQAIATKFDNRMIPVQSSWTETEKSVFTHDISGILTTNNRTVVPMTSENANNYRCLSGNMYIDSEKEIWSMKQTAAGKLLVRTTAYDDDDVLDELVRSVSSNSKNEACRGQNNTGFVGGDFLSFVSPTDAKVHCGFLVATAHSSNEDFIMLALDGENSETIDPNMTIAKAELKGIEYDGLAASNAPVTLEVLLDYYKRLYVRSPEYFNKLSERLLAHTFM